MLPDSQFDRIRRMALHLAGIELVERHRELIWRRCRRLGILEIAAVDELLTSAEKNESGTRQRLLSLLTTKFTGFFRHPRHFDLAVRQAREAVHRCGRARLWSSAAATGEEPYSLAMAVIEAFQEDEPPVEILATDIDEDALAAAGRGEYSPVAMRSLSLERRERFFSRSGQSGAYSVSESVRRLVYYRPLNLVCPTWGIEGPIDSIFCRNVLMYLEAGRRLRVLERMSSLLTSDGLLFLDPAEHPGAAGHLFVASPGGTLLLRATASFRPAERLTLDSQSQLQTA
jgi:chemotaxis protein methyltransferase CheR